MDTTLEIVVKRIRYAILPALILIPFYLAHGWADEAKYEWLLPVNVPNRQQWQDIKLTAIGQFAAFRKARPGIPAHLHTGVDIKRPSGNQADEPVFAVSRGRVVSLRDDGPYAQIIIEHENGPDMVWSLYEHIAGIRVDSGDVVQPLEPIARFMNRNELNRYGWQFDHLHLELLKVPPLALRPDEHTPKRLFRTYNLECFGMSELNKKYHHPELFFLSKWSE